MSEDAGFVLIDYLSSIDNLPPEINHIFAEMRNKELVISEASRRISSRDSSLQKYIRQHGALQVHPKERSLTENIRKDYELLISTTQDKKSMADKALALINKHFLRLDQKINKLEAEGQLVPEPDEPPTPISTPLSASRGAAGGSRLRYANGSVRSQKRRESSTKHTKRHHHVLEDDDDDEDDEEYIDDSSMLDHGRDDMREDVRFRGGNGATYHGDSKRVSAIQDDDREVYCFCRQVSYGEMVACDDPDCELEWFHLGCVGLKNPPLGKWYCNACRERREGRRPSHHR